MGSFPKQIDSWLIFSSLRFLFCIRWAIDKSINQSLCVFSLQRFLQQKLVLSCYCYQPNASLPFSLKNKHFSIAWERDSFIFKCSSSLESIETSSSSLCAASEWKWDRENRRIDKQFYMLKCNKSSLDRWIDRNIIFLSVKQFDYRIINWHLNQSVWIMIELNWLAINISLSFHQSC